MADELLLLIFSGRKILILNYSKMFKNKENAGYLERGGYKLDRVQQQRVWRLAYNMTLFHHSSETTSAVSLHGNVKYTGRKMARGV